MPSGVRVEAISGVGDEPEPDEFAPPGAESGVGDPIPGEVELGAELLIGEPVRRGAEEIEDDRLGAAEPDGILALGGGVGRVGIGPAGLRAEIER